MSGGTGTGLVALVEELDEAFPFTGADQVLLHGGVLDVELADVEEQVIDLLKDDIGDGAAVGVGGDEYR
ncbi:MAG: hypothetical protein AAFX78_14725 [Cyanobacteria bacterium J06638_20]